MNQCFRCGITENKALLFDAISEKGIIKLCRKCSFKENIPLIKKPKFSDYPEEKIKSNKKQTVYERLSRISGIDDKKLVSQGNRDLLKQEENLRDIAEQNFTFQRVDENAKDNLIDNFHWIIMRARRLKHLTQGQFAEAIAEPEIQIKEIEKGIIHEKSYPLIRKIENYLGITIMKKEIATQEKPTKLSFDHSTTMNLKISDLKQMKQERENEIFTNSSETQIKKDEIFEQPLEKTENNNDFSKF
jgi:ribosome-binding protein aMBF1 (putative translation factor)